MMVSACPVIGTTALQARLAITPFLKRNIGTTVGAQGFLAILKRNIGLGCSVLKRGRSACASRPVPLFRFIHLPPRG